MHELILPDLVLLLVQHPPSIFLYPNKEKFELHLHH